MSFAPARMNRRTTLLSTVGAGLSMVLAACRDNRETNADAQTATRAGSGSVPAGTLGLGVIGLFVANLGASLDFYRRLGLKIPDDVDPNGSSFRLAMPNNQIFFWETFAYTRQDFPNYTPAVGDRKVALEFGFRTPADLDAMYAALTAAGSASRFAPTTWPGPARYAVVVDPDDNQIGLRYPLVS